MREENKPLAAQLSSLISQILVLISLLFPSSSSSTAFPNLLPTVSSLPFLLAHFISAADSAATAAAVLSLSKKRKRAPDPDADNDPVRCRHGSSSFIPKNPDAFKHAFRMNSSTFEWLCGLLEPLLDCRDPVQAPLNLPAETRLGIGLFRLATGSDYGEVSRRFDVTQAMAKFCVKQLCRVLCTNYRFWVGFPGQTDLCSVSVQFESLSGMPNCCGVIDCLRFKILKSDANEEDTISAQFVVDASSRILSVVAGFRGNKNKFWVLKSSALYQDVENKVVMNSHNVCLDNADVSVPQYFVGDDEYPLLPWLIIPFVDPVGGSNEENFNNVVRIMRIPMVKTAASLRGWGVLSRPVDTEFKAAIASIGACSILHNMLLTREDHSAFCDEVGDDDGGDAKVVLDRSFEGFPHDLSMNEKGNAVRNALVTTAKRV